MSTSDLLDLENRRANVQERTCVEDKHLENFSFQLEDRTDGGISQRSQKTFWVLCEGVQKI